MRTSAAAGVRIPADARMGHPWRRGRLAAAATLVLVTALSSWAGHGGLAMRAAARETAGEEALSPAEGSREDGAYRLLDTRLQYPAAWRVAQGTGAPGTGVAASAAAPEGAGVSASELNKQLATR